MVEATERTPLIKTTQNPQSNPITPLPKVQLFIICLIRIVEPICFYVIFPFINQMLLEVGAAETEEEVGYAAGIVESLFSITQLMTVFHWGTLSDRIGRKPVLIFVSDRSLRVMDVKVVLMEGMSRVVRLGHCVWVQQQLLDAGHY